MNHSKNVATGAAYLTDDLIVKILSRLPVRSVCRFKCVSRHWRCLISHSEHRKKLPQTISGFFYTEYGPDNQGDWKLFPNFKGISGDQEHLLPNPSLPFMTGYKLIIPKNCCNGLVLCLCWKLFPSDEADYVVCNPATEEWVVLPDSGDETIALSYHLGFDPDISPHFHVFQTVEDEDDDECKGINIYSSVTGLWSHKENGWGDNYFVVVHTRSLFFNGRLHLLTQDYNILTVDTEGKTWRIIPLLETMYATNCWLGTPVAFICHSQGRFCYINMRDSDTSKLSVWFLNESNGNE